MNQELATAVDDYLVELLVRPDASLTQALAASRAAGLPAINVSAPQGKLLQLLARALGARNILEIGTLGGYSTIWLAQALPRDGRLVSLEADPRHAEVARANVAAAGLAELVEIRVGRALDSLPIIAGEAGEPFDLIFIDADKPNIPEYFTWAMQLCRPGSLVIVDNVVRGGAVLDATSDDANVQGVRRFYELAADSPGVSATAIQTVGSKGYDGFALVLVHEAT